MEVVELVTEYLEGALSRVDRRRFEVHLSGCPHCGEFLRQMQMTIAITGELRVDDLSPELQQDFMALFRYWRSERVDR
ncbi:MAG TPA: zf-HC2 domain-containing protein [Acidimicrobiales bacterium]